MIKRAITLLLLALPFYLAAVQQAEGRSPGPMLSSASSSKLTKQTSRNRSGELKILSERLPNGRTQYFVGQGPFTRYRDAQHALSKARARHTEASVACLPTLVAENTR